MSLKDLNWGGQEWLQGHPHWALGISSGISVDLTETWFLLNTLVLQPFYSTAGFSPTALQIGGRVQPSTAHDFPILLQKCHWFGDTHLPITNSYKAPHSKTLAANYRVLTQPKSSYLDFKIHDLSSAESAQPTPRPLGPLWPALPHTLCSTLLPSLVLPLPTPPLPGDNHCLSEKWSPQENFHKPPLQVSYLLCHSSSSMLQLTAGQQRCTRQPQAEPSEITGTSPASCQVSSGSPRQQQKCWTQLCETRSWFQPPTHLELRKSTWGGGAAAVHSRLQDRQDV